MAIDFIIDYQCYPKQEFTANGILERLKGRARAQSVIDLFRRSGDTRPVNEIGFEMARNTPEGVEETRIVMVHHLLQQAEVLLPYEHYCQGCPANNTGAPFGCIGQIDYPISSRAERWLLNQLPITGEPLPWLLLRQAIEEYHQGESPVNQMRAPDQPFFEDKGVLVRKLGELTINSNQVFQMLFLAGHLQPAYGSMLLLFFDAIARDMNADEIMGLSQSPEDAFERYPFLMKADSEDDQSITQLKAFFRALYLAWGLNVRLLMDV